MAVLQIGVRAASLDFEFAVVTKKFVACGNQYIVAVERDAAQAPVGATSLEIDLARVPVYVLLNLLLLKIDREHAAVTLALLAAAHDGCCNELW